jgi:hypothetical protein
LTEHLSTLAIEGSSPAGSGRALLALRYADLCLLAAALPLFLVAELPLVGFAVAAAAWLAQRAVQVLTDRRARAALAGGNRRGALGALAATTLGRVWFVALAILLVGKIAEREDGLAAAVLTALLVTAYLGGTALARALTPADQR